MAFTEDEKRRVVRQCRIGVYRTYKEACEDLGITTRTLRAWRDEYTDTLEWGLNAQVRDALCFGPSSVQSIIGWIDWRDHARHPEERIEAVLAELAAEGWVEHTDDGWTLIRRWP